MRVTAARPVLLPHVEPVARTAPDKARGPRAVRRPGRALTVQTPESYLAAAALAQPQLRKGAVSRTERRHGAHAVYGAATAPACGTTLNLVA